MSVEHNQRIVREHLIRAEEKSKELMAQYVANRRKSYEAYARLDPDSQFTKNAKELLDKATRDLEEFKARLVSLHDERTRLMAGSNDKTTEMAGPEQAERTEQPE